MSIYNPREKVIRWTPLQKNALIGFVDRGVLSAEEACSIHEISPEEMQSWRDAINRGGVLKLRVREIERQTRARAL